MNKPIEAVGILGVGSCVPEKVLTNSDLEKMVETSDEWITKRTGISERRVLEPDKPAYELGVRAAQNALEDSGLSAEDIDLIIVTTSTPDYLTPSIACIIQNKISAKKAAAFDLNAACSGFIYGMTVAEQFIMAGKYKYILVVACEALSKVTDWKDRSTCVLFGDGAGAAVLGPVEKGYGIISTHLGADGSLGHNLTIPCCYIGSEDIEKRAHDDKRVIWMDGGEVFKFAVRVVSQATENALAGTGVNLDDVKLVVPHQANIRIIDGAAKRLGLPTERVYTNLQRYGNISSASVPVALEEVVKENRICKGDYIVLVGFGGGLTWASALIRWNR